jgi:hypothetical protein
VFIGCIPKHREKPDYFPHRRGDWPRSVKSKSFFGAAESIKTVFANETPQPDHSWNFQAGEQPCTSSTAKPIKGRSFGIRRPWESGATTAAASMGFRTLSHGSSASIISGGPIFERMRTIGRAATMKVPAH